MQYAPMRQQVLTFRSWNAEELYLAHRHGSGFNLHMAAECKNPYLHTHKNKPPNCVFHPPWKEKLYPYFSLALTTVCVCTTMRSSNTYPSFIVLSSYKRKTTAYAEATSSALFSCLEYIY